MSRRPRTELTTPEEIAAITHHPGWDDGREGFLWCRFDAVVSREQLLRAEITWGDNGGDDDNDNPDGAPTVYFNPELRLTAETVRPDGSWKTVADRVIPLINERAFAILDRDPAELLKPYRTDFEWLAQRRASSAR